MFKFFKLSLTLYAFLIFFSFLNSSYAVEQTFSDVNEINENFVAIEYLARTGVLDGNPDGTFLPWNEINRAEVTKLVVTMQGIDPDGSIHKNCFPDVTDQWFARYVCYAKQQGWVQGYPDGYFRAENLVNEAEMLKMVLEPLFGDEIEIFNNVKQEFELSHEPLEKKFEELIGVKYISEEFMKTKQWFDSYFGFAQIYEIDNPSHPYFDPAKLAERARVAEFIFNTLITKESNSILSFDSKKYVRDTLLRERGLEELIIDSNGCYETAGLDFDFYLNYLEKTYKLDRSEDFDKKYSFAIYKDYFTLDKDDLPLVDLGYFCLTEEGYLFSSALLLSEDDTTTHLIRFNHEGEFIEDKTEDCLLLAYSWPLINLENFDPETADLIDCFTLRDKDRVYVYGNEIENADANSFEALRIPYGKDKNHAYYFGQLIPGADPDTFTTFESEQTDPKGFAAYAKDAEHVFKEGVLVENRDPASFEILNQYYYTKDKYGIYYSDQFIEGADPATFVIFEADPNDLTPWFEGYAKDDHQVYYEGQPLQGSDVKTFTFIGDGYSKDANHVYYFGSLMPVTDIESFQLFKIPSGVGYDPLAFDENYFYQGSQVADWFDVEQMELINGFFIKNGESIYYNSGLVRTPILDADPNTFQPLGGKNNQFPLAKDLKNIYYKAKILEVGDLQVSSATFLEEENVLKDATGYTCQIDESIESILQCED